MGQTLPKYIYDNLGSIGVSGRPITVNRRTSILSRLFVFNLMLYFCVYNWVSFEILRQGQNIVYRSATRAVFNLIYPFVVLIQILGSLLLLYLTGDDTTMPTPQGYTDGLSSPTQSSFDDYIIPCRQLKERSISLLDISGQTPLYEPANILKIIGSNHTPPTRCGRCAPSLRSLLREGIANKQLGIPAGPRLN